MRRLRQPALGLVSVTGLALIASMSIGLPGASTVTLALAHSGGPAGGSQAPETLSGRVLVERLGFVVRRVDVGAGQRVTLRLRPGLYSFKVAGTGACGSAHFLWPGADDEVTIVCSVK